MLAMSQFSLDRFSDAARTFATVADLAMRDPRAAYAWALSLARTDQQPKANEIVDKLSTQTLPLDQLALVCKVYDVTANYEQAVKCFQRISQQDPTFKGSHLETGAALIRLDRPTEAIPQLQAESKLSPDNLDAQYYLAYAFLQVSRKEEAATLLKSIITADPAYVQGSISWEDSCWTTGKRNRQFSTWNVRQMLIQRMTTCITSFKWRTDERAAQPTQIGNSSYIRKSKPVIAQ